MKKVYNRDIWRSIWKGKKRFFSIMLITALGVMTLTGIKAGCTDLRYSADCFFDNQGLFDLRVVSTWGLTDEDVLALQQVDGVAFAEGTYSEMTYIEENEKRQSAEIKILSENGINMPFLIEGSLPNTKDEIAVTENYIQNTGKKIGDTLEVRGSTTEDRKEYLICGIVIDVMDMNNPSGSVAFRSSSTTDYTFFVLPEAINYMIYTAVYLRLTDCNKLLCYSDAYRDRVKQVEELIERQVKAVREQERYNSIISKAEFQEVQSERMDIDMVQWYVQDRTSLSGYTNIESDADCIEAIGNAFPVIFLVVAVLISLTTVTRMIEEDRSLIGTYKALGFTDWEIFRKYLVYALTASFLGGLLGDLCGFIILPKIIFIFFGMMYLLPKYLLRFEYFYGFGGVFLFLTGVTAAAGYACYTELKQMPAVLMRPKAPQSGSRILLERITWLWNQLSFLNKVTARNLFRYKKRLFMTIAGIMGCTALLLCGFAIKDSVTDLMPRQYQQIYRYDLIAAAASDQNTTLLSYLEENQNIAVFLNVQIDMVKLKNQEEKEQQIQLMVIPQKSVFSTYIYLENTKGKAVELKDGGIYITQNAAELLHLNTKETVFLRNFKLVQRETVVLEIVRNYLGNAIYMTQETYQELFGDYRPNGVLIRLSENCKDHLTFAEELGRREEVLSSISTEELRRDFSKAFVLMNMIVYVILFLAAGLAFVVLFTLSTTNISERMRELATIKVLGFYDQEVHLYVNKETLILTGIGILLGLPLGNVLGHCLTWVLRLPSIYFAVSVHSVSYFLSAFISFGFAFLVDFFTNQTLNQIDPVDALKSVE